MSDARLRELERRRADDPQAAARLGAELERAGQVNPYQALADAFARILERAPPIDEQGRFAVTYTRLDGKRVAETGGLPLYVWQLLTSSLRVHELRCDAVYRARRRRARRRVHVSSSSPGSRQSVRPRQ